MTKEEFIKLRDEAIDKMLCDDKSITGSSNPGLAYFIGAKATADWAFDLLQKEIKDLEAKLAIAVGTLTTISEFAKSEAAVSHAKGALKKITKIKGSKNT